MPPRIVLATVGSLGDLHPFMALGLALRARGAAVVVATAAEYRDKVQRAGLDFVPVRPSFADLQRRLGMDWGELTRMALAHDDFLLRRLIMPDVRESYEDMEALAGGADLFLTSSLAFGARLAAERGGVPWIGVVLQPLMFASAYDPPVLPRAEWVTAVLGCAGPALTRPALRLFKSVLQRQLAPLAELRLRLGLGPAPGNPLFEGQFAHAGAIGLYSSLLGGSQADYPKPTTIAGFACFDSGDGGPAALDAALEAFLEVGEPPLVFTLGSLIVNSPGAFYEDSVAAARLLGRRAVILVGEDAVPGYAGLANDSVHVTGYAPHSLLFPRAAAVVHQGGIGTLAQALKSGRPQLIVPFYGDQADNAARAVRLGLALRLTPARYHARSAARLLGRLIAQPDFRRCALEARERLLREDGAAAAADVVLNRLESRPAAERR